MTKIYLYGSRKLEEKKKRKEARQEKGNAQSSAYRNMSFLFLFFLHFFIRMFVGVHSFTPKTTRGLSVANDKESKIISGPRSNVASVGHLGHVPG